MNVHTHISRIAQHLLDVVYPPSCLICAQPPVESTQIVCQNCWASIPRLDRQHPLYLETQEKLLNAGYVQNLVSYFIFEKDGSFQHIAHALKYQEFKSLGLELGRFIGQNLLDWGINVDILLPVPLHKRKFRERGYNQSEYIAKGISTVIHTPVCTSVLQRSRYTQTQTKLNAEERRQNMHDAFIILDKSKHIVSGKSCLLIDDVITTGATINACAKELLSCNCTSVIAASSALAE